MNKTKRKAKEDGEEDGGSVTGHSYEDSGSDFLVVSIPEELDHQHLAEILPEIPDLSSVSADVVVFLYELVAKQYALLDSSQRDMDELRATTEKKDVELEQFVMEKESMSRDWEDTLASVQDELAKAKQERDKLGLASRYLPLNPNTYCNTFPLQRRRMGP